MGSIIASVLDSSVVDRGFEQRSSQTKDYNTGTCCFFVKHTTLRSTTGMCPSQPADVVSVSYDYNSQPQRIGIVLIRHHHHLIKMSFVLAII